MELVADSYYRKFLAYGIGGESVHDYLQILFYRADAVRQDKVEGGPVRGYDACAGEQCRGHLRYGGYPQRCPFGEYGALSGVQG